MRYPSSDECYDDDGGVINISWISTGSISNVKLELMKCSTGSYSGCDWSPDTCCDNPSLEHTSFKNNKIDNPEKFIETSILQTITKELEKNHEKVGISLSSGIDSTLILALLRKTDPSIEIESISVKFSDSIDETENSKKNIRKVSNKPSCFRNK